MEIPVIWVYFQAFFVGDIGRKMASGEGFPEPENLRILEC